MGLCESWLRRHFEAKEIGWTEIGEKFTRLTLLHTRWFRLYLHKVNCPIDPAVCHDHPWHFWTLLLRRGYWERVGSHVYFRPPGSLLYRPARFKHAVWTHGDSWSLVLTSDKMRVWHNHIPCGEQHGKTATQRGGSSVNR